MIILEFKQYVFDKYVDNTLFYHLKVDHKENIKSNDTSFEKIRKSCHFYLHTHYGYVNISVIDNNLENSIRNSRIGNLKKFKQYIKQKDINL